jgi:CRP-like cAMP-binding protein
MNKGTVITKTGEASKSLYFVLHGRVDVFVEKKQRRSSAPVAGAGITTDHNHTNTHSNATTNTTTINNNNTNKDSLLPAKKPSGVDGQRISTLLQGDLFGVTGLINKVGNLVI